MPFRSPSTVSQTGLIHTAGPTQTPSAAPQRSSSALILVSIAWVGITSSTPSITPPESIPSQPPVTPSTVSPSTLSSTLVSSMQNSTTTYFPTVSVMAVLVESVSREWQLRMPSFQSERNTSTISARPQPTVTTQGRSAAQAKSTPKHLTPLLSLVSVPMIAILAGLYFLRWVRRRYMVSSKLSGQELGPLMSCKYSSGARFKSLRRLVVWYSSSRYVDRYPSNRYDTQHSVRRYHLARTGARNGDARAESCQIPYRPYPARRCICDRRSDMGLQLGLKITSDHRK